MREGGADVRWPIKGKIIMPTSLHTPENPGPTNHGSRISTPLLLPCTNFLAFPTSKAIKSPLPNKKKRRDWGKRKENRGFRKGEFRTRCTRCDPGRHHRPAQSTIRDPISASVAGRLDPAVRGGTHLPYYGIVRRRVPAAHRKQDTMLYNTESVHGTRAGNTSTSPPLLSEVFLVWRS